MYQDSDKKRLEEKFDDIETFKAEHPELTDWRIDKTRFLHSASFRRLNGKTQLYPNIESDYFRNRLTHSLEVAQVAVCIAHKLNNDNELLGTIMEINSDLVEFAALAHDLGHPPFGHIGELALHECMKNHGGFEGNAQTFRILTRIEKKVFGEDAFRYQYGVSEEGDDFRRGLNLTYRTLASIVKYCFPLGSREALKGYYPFDEKIIKQIKDNVIPQNKRKYFDNLVKNEKYDFKTIECSIMDIADDIAYATYDFEDSIQAGFITPFDLIYPEDIILEKVTEKVEKTIKNVTEDSVKTELEKIFNIFSPDEFIPYKDFSWENNTRKAILKEDIEKMHEQIRKLCENGHFRTKLISGLINMFINGIELKFNKEIPALSIASFKDEIKLQVEVLKQFVFIKLTMSPRLKIVDYRGREIVTKIFETISDGEIGEDGLKLSHLRKPKKGYELLPPDFREIFDVYNRLYDNAVKEEKVAQKEYDDIIMKIAGSPNKEIIDIINKIEIRINDAIYNKEINDAKRHRVICDFIAGMTNRYAIEFYGRITSEHPATIFKGY